MDNQNRFEQEKQALEEKSIEMQTELEAGQTTPTESSSEQKKILFFVILFVVLLLVLIGAGIYFLVQPTTDTAKVRDIFIIFMALESLLIGFALVILMVQLARLINLLQNEIKPILNSTQDTVGHLRGTTVFLSENLVEPVMKLNEYMAGFTQLLSVVGLAKKGKKTKTSKGE